MSVPNTFNPSDYQYLIKSLIDANHIAKSESLKRFNVLVLNDKKQFAIYSKRIVMALQDILHEPKQDINLLGAMLVHEIISLNPKDVEYYVRTKLLKHIVINLGDSKPALRKTSHYCLLAYVRTMKNFDQLSNLYIDNGMNSNQAQLRQKCINSLQSIILTQTKYLNWQSNHFKKIFETLLLKLKDESNFVQKAAEQCLLTISRLDDVKIFIKRLSSANYALYKVFCQGQKQLVIIFQEKQKQSHRANLNHTTSSHKSQKTHYSQSQINLDKVQIVRQDSFNKQAIIDRIEEIRRKSQTPKIEEVIKVSIIKKSEPPNLSEQRAIKHVVPKQQKKFQQKSWKQSIFVKEGDKQKGKEKQRQEVIPSKLHPLIYLVKTQKVQNIFGKKLLQDLKNDKDWKVRLEAIEQLQTKFQLYKEGFEIESIMKNIVPILTKLLGDQNFKIAFISLKVIEEILKLPEINIDPIVPQILDKLNDNKIALRQNVSKLIRKQIILTGKHIWIDQLLDQLKKNNTSNLREEVLNILTKLYEQKELDYSVERIVEEISPLMDDAKTKIKIKTLDLLVLVTIKSKKMDQIKNMLISRMNQVYYEMYLEKITKEVKNMKPVETPEANHQEKEKSISFPSLRKAKISANNSTSSSLQKYSKTLQVGKQSRQSHESTERISSAKQEKLEKLEKLQLFSIKRNFQNDSYDDKTSRNLSSKNTIREKANKNYKKKLQKTFQSKLAVNYTLEQETLRPFNDPEKQLKNVINQLKSEDWQIAFESINKLRRIIANHADLLIITVIKGVVVDVMRHVQNLRSSLSKNAVIVLNELSSCTKSMLDVQLDLIFTKLIKKTLDTNSFISEQVKKALISISSHCNETKVMTMICNFHNSKSLAIKQNILYVFQEIIYINRVYNKEIERIVQVLVNFLNQGALEIRERTKPLLSYIVNREKINSKPLRLIPPEFILKYRTVQSNKQTIEVAEISPRKQKQSEVVESNGPPAPAKKKRKILIFPDEFNQFQELIKKSQGSDWKLRQQSLSTMVGIMKKFPQEVSQFKFGAKMMDVISKQTSDPNMKVSINAFKQFKSIIPFIPKLVETNLSVILNELFNSFSSQKNDVRESSLQTFDVIAQNIQKWMLIQHLCNGTLYGPTKSKASILIKILKILPESCKQKKQILSKNMYTLINKLCEENRIVQINTILKQLISMVVMLGGDDALTSLRQQAKSLLSQ